MLILYCISYVFSLDIVLSYLFLLKIICHMFFVILIVKWFFKIFCENPTQNTLLSYNIFGLLKNLGSKYPINLYFYFECILAQKENMRLKVIFASTLDLYLFVNYGSIG